MPYCTNCGAEVKGDERFCSTCGHPLESQTVDINRPVKKRRKSSKVLWVIAALAIVSVAASILVLGVPWKDAEVSGELTIADETQPSTLVLGDGTTAVVPPDSLPAGATIVMRRLDPLEAPALPEGFSSAELLYEVRADQPLNKAITLRILIPEVTDESIFQLSRYQRGQWVSVPFVAKDGFAVVQTDTFSIWGWLNMQVGKLSEQADGMIMTYANPETYIDWYKEVTGLAKYMELPLESSSELIDYDDSKAHDLISASARIVYGDKIRLRVHNETKFYLQISFDGPASVEPKRGAYIDATTVRAFANTVMMPPIAHDLLAEYLLEDVLLLPGGTAEFFTGYTPDQPLKTSAQFSDVAAAFSSLDPLLGLVPIADLEMVAAARDALGEGSRFLRALPDLEKGWGEHALNLLDIIEATNRAGVLAGEKAIKTLANMLIVPAAVEIRQEYLEGRAIDILNKGADARLGGTIIITPRPAPSPEPSPTHLIVTKTRILEQGDNLIHGFTYYDGALWASTRTSPGRILKIDPNTLEYERIVLDHGLNDGEDLIAANGYIWAILYTSPSKLIRIDPNTLHWEVAISFTSNEIRYGGALEHAFGYLWAGGYGKIARIDPSNLDYDIYDYSAVIGTAQFHALASGGGYIWGSAPRANTILRINPANPPDYDSLRLDAPMSDDIAYAKGHLYVGSEVTPSYIYRIADDLSYSREEVTNTINYAVFYYDDRIWAAHVGTPGKLAEFDLDLNLEYLHTLPEGFNNANEIAFDELGNIYITCWESPAKIVRFKWQ
ncbi:hypothetical protein ES703_70500 [subsurface metagenome]